MKPLQPELVVDCRNALGEMPRWDPVDKRLFWIEVIDPGRLYSFDPRNQTVNFVQFQQALTGIATCSPGAPLLVAGEREIWRMDRAALHRAPVYALPPDQSLQRFNDGGVDSRGRLWIGTMPNNLIEPARSATRLDPSGQMLSIEPNGAVKAFEAGFACPNAICWSPDESTLYVADSYTGWLYAYDFDVAAAHINRRREFCRLEGLGIPDGAAVDADGCIWNARWDGSAIARIDPHGRLVQTIELPITKPTACCFGGSNLDVLYVTSARYGLTEEQLAHEELAGGVFAIQTSTHGIPLNSFGEARAAKAASI